MTNVSRFLPTFPKSSRRRRNRNDLARCSRLSDSKPDNRSRISASAALFPKLVKGGVVNKADGKFASGHDLRWSFDARWTKKVVPAVLQQLMRHWSIKTTTKHYVDMDAGDVAS